MIFSSSSRKKGPINGATAILFIGLFALPLGAGNILRLQRPQQFSFLQEKIVLQGTVELPSATRIEVEVQPFAEDPVPSPRRFTLDVSGRAFQGEIRLFPGLNLVSLRTPGQQVAVHFAFYCATPRNREAKSWGIAAGFILTQPAALRVETPEALVQGTASDPGLPGLFAVALSPRHFETVKGGAADPGVERLPVRWIPVKGGKFEGAVPLEPGSNVLLIRPAGAATYSQTLVKPVIREMTSPRVSLVSPEIQKGQLILKGQAPPGKSVEITISALTLDRASQALTNTVLFEAKLNAGPDGQYQLNVPMTPVGPDREVKGFPMIRVQSGKDSATRTLLDWPSAR